MAKRTSAQSAFKHNDAPTALDEHPFFGMRLDAEQKIFRDAIWNPEIDITIVNAKSGSGKTTIAVATSILLCEYGLFDGILYQTAAGVYEYKQGMLPGSLEQKNAPMLMPLYQAVARLGYDSARLIATTDNMIQQKEGGWLIQAQSDSYIRGVSFGDADKKLIVILDEAQNYTLPAIRTALTRIGDGSKAIVIGQDKQCDLKYAQDSGFVRAINLFGTVPWAKICTLSRNYRSRISALADEL